MSHEPTYVCRRHDGRYLRGGNLWRWTRFARFATTHDDAGVFVWFMGRYEPGVEYSVVPLAAKASPAPSPSRGEGE